jgi:hypothetical protein
MNMADVLLDARAGARIRTWGVRLRDVELLSTLEVPPVGTEVVLTRDCAVASDDEAAA